MKKIPALLYILFIVSLATAKDNDKKIFIIGDSTVHNNSSKKEMGWGTALEEYAKNPKNIFNLAREGSSSKSYKLCNSQPSNCYKNRNWTNTKSLIQHTNISRGAYLLIQFGHNDEDESSFNLYTTASREGSFYKELKMFVDEAKAMGVTPILITPVERMRKERGKKMRSSHTRADGNYAQTVRDLAKDEKVVLLDLQKRSFESFSKYRDKKAIMKSFAFDDSTHFSPKGAKAVARWVKELACRSEAKGLCREFKKRKK